MSGTLSFVVLHVHDLAAAKSYYMKNFNLEVEREAPGFVLLATREGSGFGLELDAEAASSPSVELCWAVGNADAQCEGMRTHGVTIVTEPEDKPFGRAFEAMDADGNKLVIYTPRG